jgi:hypothetical protein
MLTVFSSEIQYFLPRKIFYQQLPEYWFVPFADYGAVYNLSNHQPSKPMFLVVGPTFLYIWLMEIRKSVTFNTAPTTPFSIFLIVDISAPTATKITRLKLNSKNINLKEVSRLKGKKIMRIKSLRSPIICMGGYRRFQPT